MYLKLQTCLMFLLFISIYPQTTNNYMVKKWQMLSYEANLGSANIICRDIDNDGRDEIIINSGYSNCHITILKYINNDYLPIWYSKNYRNISINLFDIINSVNGNNDELVVVLKTGEIDTYNLKTLELIDSIQTNLNNPNALKINDVDEDGNQELILTYNYSSYNNKSNLIVLDGNTFVPKTSPEVIDGYNFETGDVDGDGKSEIVLASGKVLDGATHVTKWVYSQAFGTRITLADINKDSTKEIIAINRSNFISVYNAKLKTPLWEVNTGSTIYGLSVSDVDNDGIFDILVNIGYNGSITCYDSSIVKWQISGNYYSSGGSNFIAIGDLDGDGNKEVVWSSPQGSYGNFIYVGDIKSHKVKWTNQDFKGNFYVDLDDINKNGIDEIISACTSSNNSSAYGKLIVYDAYNYSTKWINDPGSYQISCVTSGNLAKANKKSVILGYNGGFTVYDDSSQNKIWTQTISGQINNILIKDLNGDGINEIITADNMGYITIFDGNDFHQIWKSIYLGGPIGEVKAADIDNDSVKELIFYNISGIIQVYDGITHYLKWQGISFPNITALDVADIDRDGNLEFIAGDKNGKIFIIDCKTDSIKKQYQACNETINCLKAEDIDSEDGNELIVGTNKLIVFDGNNFNKKWESEYIGSGVGLYGNLKVKDIYSDQYKDILVSNSVGIYHFKAEERYKDITPPYIKSFSPLKNQLNVSIDSKILVTFSEKMDKTTLNSNNINLTDKNNNKINYSLSFLDPTNTIIIRPDFNLSPNDSITVTLKNGLTDSVGNKLDGNFNGIQESEAIDSFTWFFKTGSGIDTVGPVFTYLSVQDSVWHGTILNIYAVVSDSSTVATSMTNRAECFLDSLGFSGNGIVLTPIDSTNYSVTKTFRLVLNTSTWGYGYHILYFHASDNHNNWGVVKADTIYIINENPSNWAMDGNDAQHTGFNPTDSIKIPLSLKWKKKITPYLLNNCVIINNLIVGTSYSSSGNAIIFAVSLEDGNNIWSFSFGSVFSIGSPAYAYGNVYVQTCNNSFGTYISAFDLNTGRLKWQTPYGAQWDELRSPTVADNKVFIEGGSYGGMYAYDAMTGNQLWFVGLPQDNGWTPAYYNGNVYGAWQNSCFYSINADSGSTYHEFGIPGNNAYTPAIHDGKIFTINPITAIDLTNQKILWSQTGNFTPAIAYNKVFATYNGWYNTSQFGQLNAYDETTGSTLWTFEGDQKLNHSPVVSNGFVFVSSDSNTYAINISKQKQEWTYKIGGNLSVSNNQLFVSTNSGEIYVFEYDKTAALAKEQQNVYTFSLAQNYPNPFNPSTNIEYTLPKLMKVMLKIYNTLGQEIETVVNQTQPAGKYIVKWTPHNVASGIYFYIVDTGESRVTKKMIFLK